MEGYFLWINHYFLLITANYNVDKSAGKSVVKM